MTDILYDIVKKCNIVDFVTGVFINDDKKMNALEDAEMTESNIPMFQSMLCFYYRLQLRMRDKEFEDKFGKIIKKKFNILFDSDFRCFRTYRFMVMADGYIDTVAHKTYVRRVNAYDHFDDSVMGPNVLAE